MNIKRASFDDFPRIQNFLTTIFPKDNPNYYSGFLYNDQLFSPDRIFYIEDSNRIISVLWSIPRIFKDGNIFVFSIGIANVGTHPDFRGKGYAADLINYSISLAHDEEANFVILVTEIPEYYERYGFFNLGKAFSDINISIERDNKGRISIKNAKLEEIVEISKLLYKKANLITPLRNYYTLRSESSWNRFNSHFIFNKNIARWYEVSASENVKIYIYALERDNFYEIFELIYDPNLGAKDIKMILEMLSSMKKKSLRIYGHRVLFDMLKMEFQRDKEVVMCLEIRTADFERIYLPVPDYF